VLRATGERKSIPPPQQGILLAQPTPGLYLISGTRLSEDGNISYREM
jgi:hypothetical protein